MSLVPKEQLDEAAGIKDWQGIGGPLAEERVLWRRWIVRHGRTEDGQREYTVATYSTEEAAKEVAAMMNKHTEVAVSPPAWMGLYWVKESVMRIRDDD